MDHPYAQFQNICSQCHGEVQPGKPFCPNCGVRLPQQENRVNSFTPAPNTYAMSPAAYAKPAQSPARVCRVFERICYGAGILTGLASVFLSFFIFMERYYHGFVSPKTYKGDPILTDMQNAMATAANNCGDVFGLVHDACFYFFLLFGIVLVICFTAKMFRSFIGSK